MTRRLRSATCGLALLILMAATARRSEMSSLPLDVSPSQSTPLSTVELHELLHRGDLVLLTERIESARANGARNIVDEAAMDQLAVLPATADDFYWRGRAHLALNESDQAFNDFERALALDPTHTASYRETVHLLEARADWGGVVERWTAYLSVAPGDAVGYRQRAAAYRHLGQPAPAAVDESRACDLGNQTACHAR